MEPDVVAEAKLFATFEKYDDFVKAQSDILSPNISVTPTLEEDRHESAALACVCTILDEYQEQSYLLDPFLEKLVPPIVDGFKRYIKVAIESQAKTRLWTRAKRVTVLLYHFMKCRGYKTIIRFFPHEVGDLSVALAYADIRDGPLHDTENWTLRYIFLMWLSLICMIPFDLEQFDDHGDRGKTAKTIETLSDSYLSRAGLDRESASLLLSRLFMRKDTRIRFNHWLAEASALFQHDVDTFTCMGILHALCEIAKSGPPEQVAEHVVALLEISNAVASTSRLFANTLVRKFHTKLVARIALRLLPTRSAASRSLKRALHGRVVETSVVGARESEDEDIPDDIENILEKLFTALQDKDTIVRWSAAKGIASICERLPADFVDQVLDTIIGHFAIHSFAAANLYDVPAIAEGTWHGACLACAEVTRRGLVTRDKIPEMMEWTCKALYFDIRKGAHSIGSNVRDAAAYVIWALARTQQTEVMAGYAATLSRHLVTVSLYDREIHIRRAASAAFQEHVGRMGLFPHGIDVLRKTDFYAVSVRKHAFLRAAPQVAEHLEYRSCLINHLIQVTLRHWDPVIRRLGAQSLSEICKLDLSFLGPSVAARLTALLDCPDVSDVHGSLLALAEIALAYKQSPNPDFLEPQRQQMFSYLDRVPQKTVQAPRNELITSAACCLIARSISLRDIQLEKRSSVPHWRALVEYGLRHRSSAVQDSAAMAMGAVSELVDCSAVVRRLIGEYTKGPPSVQQSLGRFLAALDYDAHDQALDDAVRCLVSCVDAQTGSYLTVVEARRNCFEAMPRILSNTVPRLSDHMRPKAVRDMFDALCRGLDDYTTDERGDVGSWIRIACIRGLTAFAELLIGNTGPKLELEDYLPPSCYHKAIGGILRQGVERLDNVRQDAGACLQRLLSISVPASADAWRLHGETRIKGLFASTATDAVSWADGGWLFPRAVQLLNIAEYRQSVLTGLILSIGSRTDSTQRPVSISLASYARTLPLAAEGGEYDLRTLLADLLAHVKGGFSLNNVVVPTFQTFNVLLEGDVLEDAAQDKEAMTSLQGVLSLATKQVGRIKNVQRVHESMKLVVNLLATEEVYADAVSHLEQFLAHQFPRIRSDTAEYLYLALQSRDIGRDTNEAEEILLNMEWATTTVDAARDAAQNVVKLLMED